MGTKLSTMIRVIISVLIGAFGLTSAYGVIATTKLNNQIKKEQTLSAEQKKENQELTDKNTLLVADKTALEADLAEIEAEKSTLSEKMIVLSTQKTTLETQLATLNKDKSALQTKYEKLIASEQELKSAKENLQTQLENAEAENEELQAEYDELLATEQQLIIDKANLQGQLDTLKPQYEALQTDYNALLEQEVALRTEYDALEIKYNNLEQKYNQLLAQGPSDTGSAPTTPVAVSRSFLMIGDNLSTEHLDVTKAWLEDDDYLYVDTLPYSGTVNVATGRSAEESYVNVIESAKAQGLGLAFVTTDVLTDDTAFRFTANGATEGDFASIVQAQYSSDFTVIMGKEYNDGSINKYASEKANIEEAGFSFLDDIGWACVAETEAAYKIKSDKMFAAFKDISISKQVATQNNTKNIKTPCLGQMVDLAVKFMENKCPNGYVMIIEDSQIANYDIDGGVSQELNTVQCVTELDRCIGIIDSYFENKAFEYSIVLTADNHSSKEIPYYVSAPGCDFGDIVESADIETFISDNLTTIESTINKVVLMIGDGFSKSHVDMMKMNYLDNNKTLSMLEFETLGYLNTASLSVLEGSASVPDSAAGGTALATGNRVHNNYIAQDAEGNNLKSLTELYKEKGMGVGVVTTDLIFEATPAAFSAHTNSRQNYVDIRKQQYEGNVDLFLGADMYSEKLAVDENGFYAVDNTSGTTTGYVCDLEQQKIKDAGYAFINDMGVGKVDMNATKIFGAFPKTSYTKYLAPLNSAETNTAPTITQMTELAIEWMELHYGDKGYFLMIEENYIDEFSEQQKSIDKYSNGKVAESIFEFDRAIDKARDMLDATGDNYVVAVSADHGAGTLTLSDTRPNYGFWNSWHDNGPVPCYIHTSAPEGLINDWWTEQLYKHTKYIAGYNDTKVSLMYDECNPFAMVQGEFGELSTISKQTHQVALPATITEFNAFSELFATFMSNFEIPTDGTEFITTLTKTDDTYASYIEFYNKAMDIYDNNSLVAFTSGQDRKYQVNSAIIGLNHPFSISLDITGTNCDTAVYPTTINYQTAIANLFGFTSKEEFMGYAQTLASTYAQHRNNIENSLETNEALDNGCFYTSNGSFVFPMPIRNDFSYTVLAYIIVDANGLVSVWVNDMLNVVKATNFNSSYYTNSPINNELFSKNILFVTGQDLYPRTHHTNGELLNYPENTQLFTFLANLPTK